MKGFSIYHMFPDSFSFMQEKLVPVIKQITKPDMIWLVGASLYRRRSESIFNTNAPTAQYTSDYFLLILIPDFSGKQQHEWQDRIEQRCSAVIPVTTIVLETSTFRQWFDKGDYFPHKIYQDAVTLYRSEDFNLEATSGMVGDSHAHEKEKIFNKGLNKARGFLAGAELFQVRNQNNLAAFMLHQSAEQALRTLLKIGMGFHINTHNIERLIRYASLIFPKLPDIFARNNDREKQLFNLLQKAYSDSRYKIDYHLTTEDLFRLADKVRMLHEVLQEVGGK